MEYISIITLGIIVNFLSGIIFGIFIIINTIITGTKDPKVIFELQQLENNLGELRRVTENARFSVRYLDTIVMLLPFANLLRMILIFDKIIKLGFNGYVIEEIERIKREG
jgi:hypothetical protein